MAEVTRDQIKEVMASTWGIPVRQVPDDASPQVVKEWDSLRHLELMMALEMSFQVRIPAQKMALLKTLDAIEQALSNP
jgi:acyl carrier protein